LSPHIYRFLFPKEGCKSTECEDSAAFNLRVLRFCVADGASECFDSRTWAWILSLGWTQSEVGSLFEKEEYAVKIINLAAIWKKKWQRRDLKWYQEEKVRRGSFAAVIGAELKSTQDGYHWKAISVGDCCLIVSNKRGEILFSFPFSSVNEFRQFPTLVSTHFGEMQRLKANICYQEGILNSDECILLMSDAISKWFLNAGSEGSGKRKEFVDVLANGDEATLCNLVKREREVQDLQNDDIAIIYFHS
jgi:hypothetical protein